MSDGSCAPGLMRPGRQSAGNAFWKGRQARRPAPPEKHRCEIPAFSQSVLFPVLIGQRRTLFFEMIILPLLLFQAGHMFCFDGSAKEE